MYLINTAQLAYVSYQNWEGYSSASPKSRVPLYLENTVPGPNIRYRHSTVYIRSSFYPHQVLCLGRQVTTYVSSRVYQFDQVFLTSKKQHCIYF